MDKFTYPEAKTGTGGFTYGPDAGAPPPVTPQKAPSVPQERDTVPTLRQGYASDRLRTGEEFGPPKPKRAGSDSSYISPNYLPGPLRAGMEWYGQHVVNPISDTVLGETLPPEMQHPNARTTPEEQSRYERTVMLKHLFADPAVALPLGSGLIGRGMRGFERVASRPDHVGAPPVQQPVPVTAPRTTPPPGGPPGGTGQTVRYPRGHQQRLNLLDEPDIGPEGQLPLDLQGDAVRMQDPPGMRRGANPVPVFPGKDVLPLDIPPRAIRMQVGPPEPALRDPFDPHAELEQRLRAKDPQLRLPANPPSIDELTSELAPSKFAGPRDTLDAQKMQALKEGPAATPAGKYRQLMGYAYDTLDAMGDRTRHISSMLRSIVADTEAGTIANSRDYIATIRSIFGNRSVSKWASRALDGQWSTLLNRHIENFGVTPKERSAVVELMVGLEKIHHPLGEPLTPELIERAVSKAAWSTLKPELLDARVHRLVVEGHDSGFGRASGSPGLQARGRVVDRVSGVSTPVGQPSYFFPHQPVNKRVANVLTEATMKQIYKAQGYATHTPPIPYEEFVTRLRASETDPMTYRKFAGVENKQMIDMIDDANAHKRTVTDSLNWYGYETDPILASIRFNAGALKRNGFLTHEQNLTALRTLVREDLDGHPRAQQWVDDVVNRTQGITQREDIHNYASDVFGNTLSVLYPAFLRNSWMQNILLQPNYAFMMTGVTPLAQATWRWAGAKLGMKGYEIQDATAMTASNFISHLAKYSHPDGPFAQYGKTMNTINAFTKSDELTRTLTHAFMLPRAESVIRAFFRDKLNPDKIRALREGELNSDEVYNEMLKIPRDQWEKSNGVMMPPVPPKFTARYAQTLTNRAMGRSGIQAGPVWASGDTMLHRVFLMLHRQIISNEGAFINSVFNAPTAGIGILRGLRFVFGAELGGTLYQGIINEATNRNFFDVDEPFRKAFEDRGMGKEAAFAARSILVGSGLVTGGLLLSGINMNAANYGGMAYGFVSPPAATILDEIIKKVEQGKLLDAAKRLQPFGIVDLMMRGEANDERKKRGSTYPRLPRP